MGASVCEAECVVRHGGQVIFGKSQLMGSNPIHTFPVILNGAPC